MGRTILSIVIGVILANVIILGIEAVGHVIFPLPDTLSTPEDLSAFIMSAPPQVLFFPLIAYATGAFLGALACTKVNQTKDWWPGVTVGGVVLLGVVANIGNIDHPSWFSVIAIILPLPLAYLGSTLLNKKG